MAFVSSWSTALARPTTFAGQAVCERVQAGRVTCPRSRRALSVTVSAKLDALIFDCDGVLADTERDAHRVAFNLAFDEQHLSVEWSETLYGRLLEVGGGKERMTAYWNEIGWPSGFPSYESQAALVKKLHARKTQLFMSLVEEGRVPLRPGVQRLVEQAVQSSVQVAVCSTSNEKAVQKIVDMLGSALAQNITVFAGDVVEKKKPSPDIYNLAKTKLNLNPSNVCVVEDSAIGLAAARAAGMPTLITKSTYTQNEDFSTAQRIVDSLDDVTLEDLTALVESVAVNA